ncbi:MAG: hypothetical protein WKF78_04995 [Candidatus Limnocylindrales bacterium]
MPDPTTPLRGRRGRDRRIAEQVATDFAARHASPREEDTLDFDTEAVGAEVDDARRAASRTPPASRRRTLPIRPPDPRPGGHRLPDLAALPSLLAATGSFATLRQRLGTPADLGRVGRHSGLVAVPHGAKTFLAATLAGAATGGEPVLWIARDAEIGDRVAEELSAWLGDPTAVAILEPRTSLAYERSELVADETAARVAALAAWRSGEARVLVASVQALVQHTIAPGDLPATPREIRVGTRIHQDALLRELLDLGYSPVTEVAGRGEFARRGGIVDVFPPSMDLPIRIESFGDEIDSLRAFDPTDQRATGKLERAVLLPASEFLLPAGGATAIRERLGRSAARPRGAPGDGSRPLRRRLGGAPDRGQRCHRRDRRHRRHRRDRRDSRDSSDPRDPRRGRRRCGRGLGCPTGPRDRPGPCPARDAGHPGRARRYRRRGGVPLAPSRRAARGIDRCGRPAQRLAGNVPPAT